MGRRAIIKSVQPVLNDIQWNAVDDSGRADGCGLPCRVVLLVSCHHQEELANKETREESW